MIARGGGGPLLALGAAYALLLVLWLLTYSPWLLAVLLLGAVFLGLMVNFFRDPDRRIGEGIVAPADGVISMIETIGDRRLIATFMNVHDVHVNRAPVDCVVRRLERIEGPKRPAFHSDAGHNFRVVYDLEAVHGTVKLSQITGVFARRIVPYVEVGAKLTKGERLGLIRFGSRVDLELPSRGPEGTLEPTVKKGDRVRAGETTIAVYR